MLDTLKTGQWIIVVGRKPPNQDEDTKWKDSPVQMIGPMMAMQQQAYEPSGIPLKVKAINLPFILVTPVVAPNEISTVNTHIEEIIPANREYVEAFKRHVNLKMALSRNTVDGSMPQIG